MASFRTMEPLAAPLKGVAAGRQYIAQLGAIAVIYIAALLVVGSSLRKQWGFPLDDSYIHQTAARSFTHHHVPGFFAGKPSSGVTSALWLFVQSANTGLLHCDPVKFNLALSVVLLAAIGILLFKLARRDGLTVGNSFLFSMAPALCGNFIWLGLIGMEHLLFVFTALAAIWCWTDPRPIFRSVLAGGCAGALVLIRPEAVIFLPIFLVAHLRAKRSRRDLILLIASWLPFCILLFCFNFYTSHALLPTTWKGRSWLYSHTDKSNPITAFFYFFLDWFVIREMQFSGSSHSEFVLLGCAVLIAFLLGVGGDWLWHHGREGIRMIFLFAAAHFIIFGLMLPSPGQGGRYQPLNLLLFFPCFYFGVQFVCHKIFTDKALALRASICIGLIAGIASLLAWRSIAVDGITVINDTHKQVATWLTRNLPAGDRVAVFDIGAISYESPQEIVDLGGLIDPSYIPYLETRRAPEYLRTNQVHYAVIPGGNMAAALGFSSPPLRKLTEFCTPPAQWRVAFFYTLNAAQCQVIYRIAAQ